MTDLIKTIIKMERVLFCFFFSTVGAFLFNSFFGTEMFLLKSVFHSENLLHLEEIYWLELLPDERAC